ncbi:hypothetical protein TELCIR_06825 [Teladorsagia circumcincta]|uniref:DUF3719 domain-containing protein n=1 Tax=Teladorsagia circumcincta TaxID=45464 RepID=A0A2G9UNI5_TELCI|nr:hypothetical protein TELCIR_06825 [Teladorsagia circumcincta]
MSRWSESIYSEPNTSRDLHHGFLTELDARLYEGVPMNDPVLDAEAGEWAARFVHLRVRGLKCVMSTRRPDGGESNGGTRKPQNEVATTTLPAAAEMNAIRSSRISPVKKGSSSATVTHSTSDHLPKLKDMKR